MDQPLAMAPAQGIAQEPSGSGAALPLPFPSLGLRVSPSICHRAGAEGARATPLGDGVGPAWCGCLGVRSGREGHPGVLRPPGARGGCGGHRGSAGLSASPAGGLHAAGLTLRTLPGPRLVPAGAEG